MDSMSHEFAAVGHGKHAGSAESDIANMIESILAQYKDEADIVAAKRADYLFRAGNVTEATQWLNVFRAIAMSH